MSRSRRKTPMVSYCFAWKPKVGRQFKKMMHHAERSYIRSRFPLHEAADKLDSCLIHKHQFYKPSWDPKDGKYWWDFPADEWYKKYMRKK